MSSFVKAVDRLSQACGIFAMLLLAAAVLVVCEMILVRYVLRASTVWQTEFVIYSLMAATFIGSPYVLLYKGHVGVDLLPNALDTGGKKVLAALSALLSLVFLGLLAWSSWSYFHDAWSGGWTTDTVWALPLWIPILPLPVGMALMCLQYVAELVKLFGDDGDA